MSGVELGQQALAEVAGGDAGRIERLDEGQGLFGPLQLLGRGIGGQQIAEAGAEIAAVLGIERADDPLAEGQQFGPNVELAELVHQIVLQRFGPLGDVGDDVVGPLGVFLDAAGGAAGRFFEVVGHFAVEIEQPLEIVGVVVGLIDDERLVVDGFFAGVVALDFLVGQRGVALLQFQRGILDQLLLDALLQLLQREAAGSPSTGSSAAPVFAPGADGVRGRRIDA